MSREVLERMSAEALAKANAPAPELEEQTLMEQATEMVEHAKETITEMVYGAPAPEPLPRLQPFKAPLYKSAHGKEWLLSERDQLRSTHCTQT